MQPEQRVNLLSVLPSDALIHLVDLVPANDCLPLNLTCKAMASHMPKTLQQVIQAQAQPTSDKPTDEARTIVITALHSLENRLTRDKSTPRRHTLLCSLCVRFRPLSRFADKEKKPVEYQGKGRKKKGYLDQRSCICCYSTRARQDFRQGGQRVFYCGTCDTVKPVAADVRSYIVASKGEAICKSCIIGPWRLS